MSTPLRCRPPELLAPAGGISQLRAAIENGADAVYFGLQDFNARAGADGFHPEGLAETMAGLHERGLFGFVTLNTLIFDEELTLVRQRIELLARCHVDAVIVQDLGVVHLIREVAPDLVIHGSTQMTVTSAEGAELVASLGVQRVVLARELSVRQIAQVRQGTDLELEAFVHGALCVSYSGQCFSSEAWGGRSANRGQCAQACRLPYDLLVDGAQLPLGDVRYLLSPRDLIGVEHVGALIDAGVACLKIEGRLKGPEYVALTCQVYREAIDAAWAGASPKLEDGTRRDLELVFSRGLGAGFLDGPRQQQLVGGRFPKHRGLRVGTVTAVEARGVRVRLQGPIKPGDGLVFDAGHPEDDEVGGTVNTVLVGGEPSAEEVSSGEVLLRFGPRTELGRVRVGERLWKTRDPALDRRLRQSFAGGPRRRTKVHAVIEATLGQPLSLLLRDEDGDSTQVFSPHPLEAARSRPLDEPQLRAAIGQLGDTSLVLETLQATIQGDSFAPLSVIKELRRRAAADLLAQRRARRPARAEPPQRPILRVQPEPLEPGEDQPQLSVLCRSPEQVSAVLTLPAVREVAVDFLEVRGLGDAIRQVQQSGRRAIAVAPRVLKPDEERLRGFLLKLGADAILVRSLGLLYSLLRLPDQEVPPLHGDFSLNAANRRSVDLLIGMGLSRLAPGHDLNSRQLYALAAGGAERLEIVLHHHLPIFHTEHCVFCRFLSDGEDKRDCGEPCERHELHLRSEGGARHLVRADMGCRNTVFNAEAQSGIRQLPSFLRAGYRRFRIELVDHRADEVAPLLGRYLGVLDGEGDPREIWRWLREEQRFGATLGSLRVIDERR